MRIRLGIPALCLLLSAPALAVAPASPPQLYREGEVLVKYRDSADARGAVELRGRLGLTRRARLIDRRHEWLRLPAMTTVEAALPLLRREPAVEYAEPNFRRFAKAVTPNDPLFGEQWGLQNTGQANFFPGGPAGVPGGDMNLPAAWSVTTGDGSVTVGIIDDAVWTQHEDLAANIAPGAASFTSSNSNPDDPNLVTVDTSPGAANPDPNANPSQEHGTWVAGCIGAAGNNGKGVAGAAWNVKLLPLKFDFFTGAEVAAMQYAASHGAKVVNGSFGGPSFSQTELDAINNVLGANDILFVVAAGNEDSNTDFAQLEYPANYGAPNIVAAAATNRQDEIASFSNYGPTTVDVAAPGLQIVSTQYDPAQPAATNLYSNDQAAVAGTSFASPYTAGVAALVRMQNPSADYAETKARLVEGAAPGLGTDYGTDPDARRSAGGRVDAAQSLALPASPSITIGWTSFSASLDPGTTPGVDVNLANHWLDATGVTATLSASTDPSNDSNGDVTVTSGAAAPVDIAGGQSAVVHFDLAVASGQALHKYVYFTLQLSANGGAYAVKRHFMSELATLQNGVKVTQPFQSDIYDDFHTWHVVAPPGSGRVTFTSTTGNDAGGHPIDIDLLGRFGAPAVYQIELGCSGSSCVYCTSGTTANCVDPAVHLGATNTGNETVNFANVLPGDYYVTVVNYGQPVDANGDFAPYDYTLKAVVAPQLIQFNAASYSAAADSGSATITVTRVQGTHGTVTASFATSDGTATAGTNYSATQTTVTFGEGVTSRTVPVPVQYDPAQSGSKTVNLALSGPGGGAALGTTHTAVLTITQPATVSVASSSTFGNQAVQSTSSPNTVTLTNSGGAALNVGTPTIAGANASDFAISGNTCTSAVAPGSNCTISVTFTPAATGSRIATLSIPSNAPNSPNTVSLTGTGIQAALSVAASSSFGSQVTGTTSAANGLVVTNSGSADLNVGTPTLGGANAGDYAISGNTCAAAVAPGNSCTISVTFTPAATGSRTATLNIPSNAPTSPDPVSLSGTGVTPPAATVASSSSFGNQTVGSTSGPNGITVTDSGGAPLNVGTPTITGAHAADYAISGNTCAAAVAPGNTCTISVTFTPGATGSRNAALNIPSNAASSPNTVALSGTGVQAAMTVPASSSFAGQGVGTTSAANAITVTNSGSAALNVGMPAITGANASDFAISGNTCTSAVAPGSNCTISVTFTPAATGSRTATLNVPSNAPSSPDAVSLSGTGVQPGLSVAASSSFGSQVTGTTSAASGLVVTSSGSADLNVGAPTLSGANAGDYAISGNTCTAAVPPGNSCTISVTFTPGATGSRTATLNITSNAPSSPDTVNLSGTGAAPPPSGGGGGGAVTFGGLTPLLAALWLRRRKAPWC